MKNFRATLIISTALAVTAGWSSSACAALVTIFDPTGQSDFSVTYDDAQTGVFGQPQIANNTVFFIPNDFFASSSNGLGPDTLNDNFLFRLDVLAGHDFSLDQFDLTERGDYRLNGDGATVSVEGELQAYDTFNQSVVFADVLDTGPLNIADNQLHNWSGNASIGSTDGWTGTTSAWISIDSTLTADTQLLNEFAFVEKKFTGIAIELAVTQVPLPPAIWLFVTAFIALAGSRAGSDHRIHFKSCSKFLRTGFFRP